MCYQQNAVESTHSRSIAYARSAKRFWHSTKELLRQLTVRGSAARYLRPFRLATRPVTNRDWIAFMEDDGYRRAPLWLMDGSPTVHREGGTAHSTGGSLRPQAIRVAGHALDFAEGGTIHTEETDHRHQDGQCEPREASQLQEPEAAVTGACVNAQLGSPRVSPSRHWAAPAPDP
jgi:formylglycine-generating enzyme required for sulfatase activity